MYIIILMIAIVLVSIIVSNQPLTDGLRKLNELNQMQVNLNRSIESLTTIQNLMIAQKPHLEAVKEATTIFDENLKQLKNSTTYLPAAKEAVSQILSVEEDYKASVSRFSKSLSPGETEAEIAALTLMYNEIYEALRSMHLDIRAQSERTFSSIYNQRFTPLYVGLIVSIVFVAFVFLYGLNLVKYIQASIKNLTIATEEISSGNFNYRAPLIGNDELSSVTEHFNTMVDVLNEKQSSLDKASERISRLQFITSSFSETLTSDEVCEIVLQQAFSIVGADAGGMAIINEETKMFEYRVFQGYGELSKPFEVYPVDSDIPIAHALKENAPLFYSDVSNIEDLYPEIKGYYDKRYLSLAVMPLTIGETKLGAVHFSFLTRKDFSQEDKNFLQAIARQTAQALHRSILFEKAKNAVSLRDEFLSIASHELKTPLTPLKLHLQSLIRIISKGEPTHDQLVKIATHSDRQITRISSLIEDLLDVSRITAGKLSLHKEKFSLPALIQEILVNYGEQIKRMNSTVHVEVEPDIIVNLDRLRIEQVLVNLITNAGKYAPGKPIEIKLKRINENKICLQVIDQGPGISNEDQKRIFNRFERVRSENNIGGLGLGLYISKQIIEAHGGHISVVSEPGHGAKFNLELPVES